MLICGLLFWFLVQPGPPAATADAVADAANLRFHSAFWPNLHHTLYVAAWDRRPAGAGGGASRARFPNP